MFDAVTFRLAVANAASPPDIFGPWGDWGESWAQDIETRPKADIAHFPREPRAEVSPIANEVVDIRKLRSYAPHGDRQEA